VKTYTVVFAPEAEDNLVSLYEYIAEHGSPVVAARYTEAIVAYCESFGTLPHRGTKRDDIRPGLRITNYKRRAVIAFDVDDTTSSVAILGVFYGGRDYERALGEAGEDDFADP
jgi:toxin ParE1/3/4